MHMKRPGGGTGALYTTTTISSSSRGGGGDDDDDDLPRNRRNRAVATNPQKRLPLPVEIGSRIALYLTTTEILRALPTCKTLNAWLAEGMRTVSTRFAMSGESKVIKSWLRVMRAVQELRLSNVLGNTVTQAARHIGPRLRSLDILDAFVSDRTLVELSTQSSAASLEAVFLGSSSSSRPSEITDAGLVVFVRKIPNIRTFHITNAPQVTSAGLRELTACCPRLERIIASCSLQGSIFSTESRAEALETLDVCGCHEICDEFLTATPLPPRLRVLRVNGSARLTDAALRELEFLSDPTLDELVLSNCPGLTDAGLQALADKRALDHLQVFDGGRCIHFTDSAVIPLVRLSCAALRVLNLQSCFRVTDALLEAMGKARMPALEEVDFKGLNQLTDRGVEAMVRCGACANIRKLGLSSCTGLGDDALKAIAKHCPRLLDLNVFCVHKISERGLWALAFGCPELARLNVSWCFRLTSDVIKDVTREFKNLTEVVALGLDAVQGEDGSIPVQRQHGSSTSGSHHHHLHHQASSGGGDEDGGQISPSLTFHRAKQLPSPARVVSSPASSLTSGGASAGVNNHGSPSSPPFVSGSLTKRRMRRSSSLNVEGFVVGSPPIASSLADIGDGGLSSPRAIGSTTSAPHGMSRLSLDGGGGMEEIGNGSGSVSAKPSSSMVFTRRRVFGTDEKDKEREAAFVAIESSSSGAVGKPHDAS